MDCLKIAQIQREQEGSPERHMLQKTDRKLLFVFKSLTRFKPMMFLRLESHF